MNPLEKMRARLAELRAELKDIRAKRGAVLEAAVAESRSLTDAERQSIADYQERAKAVDEQIPLVEERIAELEVDKAIDDAAEASRAAGNEFHPVATVTDPPVYAPDYRGRSYFMDLYRGQVHGDVEARERLVRASKQAADETRALGNTGAAGGSGGELSPPLWLVSDFVKLARPGRVTANLFPNNPLPDGVSSINIPKISGGTTTAIQSTQNSALSQTDMTTTSVASNISTIGGKQVVSQQLLDQSAIPFDMVVLGDLAADYAKQLDLQVLAGSGSSGQLRGLANGASVGSTTYTQATPAVGGSGGLYAKIASAYATVEGARYLPPTAIIMHPRRWAFVLAAFDSQNRPLVNATGPGFNLVGTNGALVAEGYAGNMAGLPVYTDPNISITNNSNQDIVYVLRVEDVFLWESALRMEAFRETYADSAGVLFRALGYSAFIPDRYGPSVNLMTGTGLTTPSF